MAKRNPPRPKPVFNERDKQRAAYDFLKSIGQKVKPNFEDYISGRGRNRSLINRVNKLTPAKTNKEYTTETGTRAAQYARYEVETSVEYSEAIEIAKGLITLHGNGYDQCMISMYGSRYNPPKWFWVSGTFTAMTAVRQDMEVFDPEQGDYDTVEVNVPLPLIQFMGRGYNFDVVTIIAAYFKKHL